MRLSAVRTSCSVEVVRQQVVAASSSGAAPTRIPERGTHLVLLDLKRHVVTELVDADKRVVEGAHAVLAQGEIDESHAGLGSLLENLAGSLSQQAWPFELALSSRGVLASRRTWVSMLAVVNSWARLPEQAVNRRE